MQGVVLAIDAGGTSSRAALIDLTGSCLGFGVAAAGLAETLATARPAGSPGPVVLGGSVLTTLRAGAPVDEPTYERIARELSGRRAPGGEPR
jgi:2-keto-3-deoxy-galactonokinase